jgi:glycosyltransferase involved in cell wall biosynthesis
MSKQSRAGRTTPDVVIVGPTHPHTGGIAQHNTRLALELHDVGVSVRIESWKAQYPKGSRNGLGELPRDQPELPLVDDVVERLAWYSPLSWMALIGRVWRVNRVVFTVVTPFHAVPYLLPVLAIRRRQRFAIVHNVMPHERRAIDQLLMATLLRRMSGVIVHSDQQRQLALELGVRSDAILVTPLPDPGLTSLTDVEDPPALRGGEGVHVLFFGMVRHYKGLDVLLEAVAKVPEARLTVAGHFWEPIEKYQQLIDALGIRDRVVIESGYVSAGRIPELFADADVLVLPYRSGTASIVTETAFRFGRPVIVTDVGTLSEGIMEGGWGIVVRPEDSDELAAAIRQFADRSVLRAAVEAVTARADPEAERWAAYVEAIARQKTAP